VPRRKTEEEWQRQLAEIGAIAREEAARKAREREAKWQETLRQAAQASAQRADERARWGGSEPDPLEVLADAVAQRVALVLAERGRRLALSLDEAAEALGISRDHFDNHVRGRIRTAHVGARVLVPVRELERFLEQRRVP
jgi:excisionase family DNA binding protein